MPDGTWPMNSIHRGDKRPTLVRSIGVTPVQKRGRYLFINIVVPQGLEPRLFWTKTRRVANYTIGQFARLQGLEP